MAFRNSWENRKKREAALSKAQAQINIVKDQYQETEAYPETITDGWHLVMVTDNYNYCSPAKVLVKENDIKRFVANDCYISEIVFEPIGSIKKGKARLNLKVDENTTDNVEVYFNNDLEEPTIVDPPLNQGYISFWSDMNKSSTIKIWIEGIYFGELGEKPENIPQCGDEGTMTLAFKPGTYEYKAAGRGSISWKGTFTIKEGTCFIYLLNKENKE